MKVSCQEPKVWHKLCSRFRCGKLPDCITAPSHTRIIRYRQLKEATNDFLWSTNDNRIFKVQQTVFQKGSRKMKNPLRLLFLAFVGSDLTAFGAFFLLPFNCGSGSSKNAPRCQRLYSRTTYLSSFLTNRNNLRILTNTNLTLFTKY